MKRREDEGLRNAATFVALFGLLAMAGGLCLLMATVLPTFAAVPILAFCFVLLLVVQYLFFGAFLPTGNSADDSDDPPTDQPR